MFQNSFNTLFSGSLHTFYGPVCSFKIALLKLLFLLESTVKNDLAGHNNVNEGSIMNTNSSNYGHQAAFEAASQVAAGLHNNNDTSSHFSSFPVMSKIFPHAAEPASPATSTDMTRLAGKQNMAKYILFT